ncbi:4a-hydroxytetrahydrobiopterin dehydratase [Celerinatantimonas sp. YJH-8]|uniref:4a-hydroxytetrahydrobiopterin dehydratase n=1 Tax=Celerinatantimonas sp. YJH-8 TaxID=3228714 RepID=UPI0038BF22BE
MAKNDSEAHANILADERIQELMAHLNQWQLQLIDGHPRLVKNYLCQNFAGAMLFANQIGNMAELEGHHPRLLIEFNRVKVSWWTHQPLGLTEFDFVMAVRCDELAERNAG